jgi:hypothetical protein
LISIPLAQTAQMFVPSSIVIATAVSKLDERSADQL